MWFEKVFTISVIYVPVTRTWDGGGTDNLWTTTANWVDDGAPLPSDNLVFPAGAAQPESVNDYPTGTHFGSIIISGSEYNFLTGDLSSSSVQLQSGAQLTATSINTDTLTIGAGATLTIAPIAGGPLAADSALTSIATDALLPNQNKTVTQPTAAITIASSSTITTIAAGPLADSTVLAAPTPASIEVASALASSGSLSNTILDAVAVPTPIVADITLPVHLVESTPARLIDTAINRLPSQSPIYSWPDSTALPKIIENRLENSLAGKQTSNANTTVFASLHDELPSRVSKFAKHPITLAINSRLAHLATLRTIVQNPHFSDAEAKVDLYLTRHSRAGKHSKQLEKAIDEVLAEEDAILVEL